MSKIKKVIPSQPENDTFDWDLYADGYNGRNLSKNSKVNTKGISGKVVVYSHEHYANDVFNRYFHVNSDDIQAKDLIAGNTMQVIDVHPLGKTELIIDTNGGGSCRIDLNKEREYVKLFKTNSPEALVEAFKDEAFRKEYIDTKPIIKVIDKARVSLWEGHVDAIEKEFEEQLRNPTSAYYATILEANMGGYIVDVNGLKCFMPGSMAAAGIITDFESLVGKTIPVMVVNYIFGKGYIVSYKKYLATIMPNKVREELSVDMRVKVKVTGLSRNGVFVQFDDKDGEPTFSGLIYRDEMSPHMEDLFNEGLIVAGDEFPAFIHSIDVEGERVRIVLGDTSINDEALLIKKEALKNKKA